MSIDISAEPKSERERACVIFGLILGDDIEGARTVIATMPPTEALVLLEDIGTLRDLLTRHIQR